MREEHERSSPGRTGGVITVFFSLSLLLIIVLLAALLEAARIGACRGIAERIMAGSTRSLLGSYSLPLYENYHIFGRCSEGIGNGDKKALENELEWFLRQNAEGQSWLDPSFQNVKISAVVTLTEDGGAAFYEQAVQYAKYRAAGDLAKWLFSSAGQLEEAQQVGLVLQKTMRAQQGAAKVEQTLLELLECVDGFETDGSCVLQNIIGQPKMKGAFIKKIIPESPVQDRLIPGNSELFRAQRWHYCIPSGMLRDAWNSRLEIERAEEELQQLQEKYQKIKGLEEENEKELLSEMEVQTGIISGARGMYYGLLSSLLSEAQGSRQKSEQAVELIDRLYEERDAARKQLQEYAEELEHDKEGLPEEIYAELKEENEELLAQLSQENRAGFLTDIAGMRSALLYNAEVFRSAESRIAVLCKAPIGSTQECEAQLKSVESVFQRLRPEKLVFAYEDIVLSGGNGSITGTIYQLVRYGLAGLVLEDSQSASRGRISGGDLPSAGAAHRRGSWLGFSFSELFDGQDDAMFLLEQAGISGALSEGLEELLEQALFLEYLNTHFADYTSGQSAEEQKDDRQSKSTAAASGYTASRQEAVEGLAYQLEYIIFGETCDADNLSAAITRIFFIRYAMNMLALYSSRECRLQMKQAAAAIVGFTGIGALVLLTELLIGMLWAAECAVVETARLVRGGETGFFVQRGRQAVSFGELTAFSKNLIGQKVTAMSERKPAGVMKSYREYLYLFLILKEKEARTLAAMDVVQQAIRLKYNDNFRLKDCVYGVLASADVVVPCRFLRAAGIFLPDEIKSTYRYSASY